jgi:dienelactone hydrolase
MTALAFALFAQAVLPGTAPLAVEGDAAAQMVDGIHRFLDRETAEAQAKRASVTPGRERLRKIIGAVDARVGDTAPVIGEQVFKSARYSVHAVHWPVFPGVTAEGLLFEPRGTPVARIVAVPDADTQPESEQFARRLAASGCQVLVPVLMDRSDRWSGVEGIRFTNQPHREWIYRMSFEVGRHIIGYEVQKVLAAVDWFARENQTRAVPIGLVGSGEGGLIALHSAALDARIQATVVSGYFQSRENLWTEPIYRDVWGFLREFGDAELARMIAPRVLIVEAGKGPEIAGPPPATRERRGAAPNGRLVSPPLEAVLAEVQRANVASTRLVTSDDEAVAELLKSLGGTRVRVAPMERGEFRPGYDPLPRLHRQFDELVEHTQKLVRESPGRRAQAAATRNYVWEEVIGRLPDPSLPANPRTRLIYDEPKYLGYEVRLDVWPDVFADGILLVPKGIQPGERRPVVVCQHGLEGRPRDVADPQVDSPYYHRFAVRLAEQGFVTFSPQNPYIGEDRFRLIQRKAHPLKLALFSFIIGQHQRIVDWLGALPFADPKRIGFYGLSYGGKTAMRVPPFVPGYALSICSADFNEWVWKTTNLEAPMSYMLTNEYDMYEFDFANVVNYAELAMMIAPRPFMVERGHADGVGLDEWVAFEFAKVRRHYAVKLGLPGNAEIEFFNGPHTINGQGTFQFLKRHLGWPE